MASTKVTGEVIQDLTIRSTKVDSSIAKVVSLTQAAYDALGSYDNSTLYITT
jgi:hypothetical protein